MWSSKYEPSAVTRIVAVALIAGYELHHFYPSLDVIVRGTDLLE